VASGTGVAELNRKLAALSMVGIDAPLGGGVFGLRFDIVDDGNGSTMVTACTRW
jgi:hypothetical protein